MPLVLLGPLAAAARAQQQPGLVSDASYFRGAPKAAQRDLAGIIDVLVSHRQNRTRGPRELNFYAAIGGGTTPVKACADLDPGPSSDKEERRVAGRVCGVRLIGWALDDAGDHIQLAVTAGKRSGGALWCQVLLDPAEDSRGWMKAEPPPGEDTSAFRFIRLEEWVRSTGRVAIPARLKAATKLQKGPYEDSALSERQFRDEPGDLRLTFLGLQGPWMEVQQEEAGCRGEEAGMEEDSERRRDSGLPCASGWIRWRGSSGGLFVFPAGGGMPP